MSPPTTRPTSPPLWRQIVVWIVAIIVAVAAIGRLAPLLPDSPWRFAIDVLIGIAVARVMFWTLRPWLMRP